MIGNLLGVKLDGRFIKKRKKKEEEEEMQQINHDYNNKTSYIKYVFRQTCKKVNMVLNVHRNYKAY